jgi:hypothetical protein
VREITGVLLRQSCNRQLADACRWWAFAATENSPDAKAFNLRHRAAGDGPEAALRRLANSCTTA